MTGRVDKKMTESEIFQLAEAADLLGEYGYDDEADLIGRISANEQIMLYEPTSSPEQRRRTIMVHLGLLEETARKLAAQNKGNEAYEAALFDLLVLLSTK